MHPAPGQPRTGAAGFRARGRGFVMHHVMRIWRRYRTDLIHAFGAAFIVGVIFSVCVYALALASTVTGEGIR